MQSGIGLQVRVRAGMEVRGGAGLQVPALEGRSGLGLQVRAVLRCRSRPCHAVLELRAMSRL